MSQFLLKYFMYSEVLLLSMFPIIFNTFLSHSTNVTAAYRAQTFRFPKRLYSTCFIFYVLGRNMWACWRNSIVTSDLKSFFFWKSWFKSSRISSYFRKLFAAGFIYTESLLSLYKPRVVIKKKKTENVEVFVPSENLRFLESFLDGALYRFMWISHTFRR